MESIRKVCNLSANRSTKHIQLCQKICQYQLGKQAYLQQCNAMSAGLSYNCHIRKKVMKQLFTINNLLAFLSENPTIFSTKELCRDNIPACLKPGAQQVEYIKQGKEDLRKKTRHY